MALCRSLRNRRHSVSCTPVLGLLGSRSFQPRREPGGGGEWDGDSPGLALTRPSGIADAAFLAESLLRDSAFAACDDPAAVFADAGGTSSADGKAGAAKDATDAVITRCTGSKSMLLSMHSAKSCCGGGLDTPKSGSLGRSKRLQCSRTSI